MSAAQPGPSLDSVYLPDGRTLSTHSSRQPCADITDVADEGSRLPFVSVGDIVAQAAPRLLIVLGSYDD
jgi:hypothetical protein